MKIEIKTNTKKPGVTNEVQSITVTQENGETYEALYVGATIDDLVLKLQDVIHRATQEDEA